MGEGSASLVWFAAPGFRVLGIDEIDGEVVVEVETENARVACPGCGVFGRAKDRERDPIGGPGVMRLGVGCWWSTWRRTLLG